MQVGILFENIYYHDHLDSLSDWIWFVIFLCL